jgi:hypothetical protein
MSFDGDAGLCGSPLSKQCGTPDTWTETNMKSSSSSADVVLFLCAGVGFRVGFAAALIVVKLGWLNKWFRILRILWTWPVVCNCKCDLPEARAMQRRCNMSCAHN